ncbi:MAG: alanine racemase [Bacteroidales bacterium]|nr:alanine racemase [Bacteroidales bacterium]
MLMQLKRPTLLLDHNKCLANISFMAEKAARHQVVFRPHFKTHQSAEIGSWFRDFGVTRITVSSVTMAEYFAKNGWNDITIAFPLNLAEMDEINDLAGRITLNVLVENPEAVEALAKWVGHPVNIFVKIDAGYHRTGIEVEKQEEVLRLVQIINSKNKLTFKGLIVHNGNTYQHANPAAILNIHNQSLVKLRTLKTFLLEKGIVPMLSVGDTPALSLTENLDGVDEIRPGNFVFYDLMQQKLGSCRYNQIAVALACPVVAIHPERLEVVIYGGAIHLSKEFIPDENGNPTFGEVVWLNEKGWSEPVGHTFIKSLSQEHGIIKTTRENISRFYPGQFVGILPVHSCLTTNLASRLITLDGQAIDTIRSFTDR